MWGANVGVVPGKRERRRETRNHREKLPDELVTNLAKHLPVVMDPGSARAWGCACPGRQQWAWCLPYCFVILPRM